MVWKNVDIFQSVTHIVLYVDIAPQSHAYRWGFAGAFQGTMLLLC